MSLHNERELIVSQEKLERLQCKVAELMAQNQRSHADELSIQSLMKLVNQLKVEIAWYESKSTV